MSKRKRTEVTEDDIGKQVINIKDNDINHSENKEGILKSIGERGCYVDFEGRRFLFTNAAGK